MSRITKIEKLRIISMARASANETRLTIKGKDGQTFHINVPNYRARSLSINDLVHISLMEGRG